MKKQYRQFNLAEALQGNVEVETKSGYKVKQMYLFEDTNNHYPLVCLVERKPGEDVGDFIYQYTKDGLFYEDGRENGNDLRMYDKVAVCYVNIYMSNDKKFQIGQGHNTKQLALDAICAPKNFQYLKTIEITEQTTEDIDMDDDSYNELGMNDVEMLLNVVQNMFGGDIKNK
jgi:hypothetical protein